MQGQFLSPSWWRETNSKQQHVYRLKLNNHQEMPWLSHAAVTQHARTQGEEGSWELGWSLWELMTTPHLQEAEAATEKVILRSTRQLRLRQGEGETALGSDQEIQGEEPLGEESWDRPGPTSGFLGQWPHLVQFMLINLIIPQALASSSLSAHYCYYC